MSEMTEDMLGKLFGARPPEISPEAKAAFERWDKAHTQMLVDERLVMLAWAPLFCTCRKWYEPDAEPPQAGCPIHSVVSWDPVKEQWFW